VLLGGWVGGVSRVRLRVVECVLGEVVRLGLAVGFVAIEFGVHLFVFGVFLVVIVVFLFVLVMLGVFGVFLVVLVVLGILSVVLVVFGVLLVVLVVLDIFHVVLVVLIVLDFLVVLRVLDLDWVDTTCGRSGRVLGRIMLGAGGLLSIVGVFRDLNGLGSEVRVCVGGVGVGGVGLSGAGVGGVGVGGVRVGHGWVCRRCSEF
jgi:hypothetical protein